MMSVFKRRRRRGGKVRIAGTYTGRYTVGDDPQVHCVPLHVRDKGVALERLREIVRKAERRQHGLDPSEQESRRAGLTMREHLAGFVADLRARGRGSQYMLHMTGRVGRLIDECGWTTLRDVDAGSFQSWRSRQVMAPKTLNEYLAAIKALLTWMGVKHENPLTSVRPVEVRGRETFARRALTDDECRRLLDVAGSRRVVYLAALLTGFRRGTLCALRWGHVHLDDESPRIVVPAALVKNRHDHVAPLRDDLAAELRSIRPEGASEGASVFGDLLPRYGTEFLYDDLERAGVPVVDDLGRRVDFHALRHTAATLAASTGIHGHVLQGFTGHRTASQAARYCHVNSVPVRALVERMPRWDSAGQGECVDRKGTLNGTQESVPERPFVSVGGRGDDAAEVRKSSVNQREITRNRRFRRDKPKASRRGFEPLLPG